MKELLISLGRFHRFVDAALDHLHIRKDELHIDDINITPRIGSALDMDDIFIIKTAHHVDDCIRRPDVAEEFVAKAFALACPFYESGNVHKFNDCIGHLFGVIQPREKIYPLIRNRNHAHIRLNGAERKVCRLCTGICNRIKKSGFAHIRQPDNT